MNNSIVFYKVQYLRWNEWLFFEYLLPPLQIFVMKKLKEKMFLYTA